MEQAIAALGRGFLSCPANHALREELRAASSTPRITTGSCSGSSTGCFSCSWPRTGSCCSTPSAGQASRDRYARFYSTARLRQQAERLRGTQHADLFEMLQLVMDRLGSADRLP